MSPTTEAANGDDHDLVGGALHIAFEWQTVVDMAVLLSRVVGDRTQEENAYLESGLLHYRCLVNFCCGDTAGRWHANDMKPADFLGHPWWPADEEFDRRLRGRLPLINQTLHHLAWQRLEHGIMWPFGFLAHEAHYLMGLFLEKVPEAAPWRTPLDSAQALCTQRIPEREAWTSTTVPPAPPR